MTNGSRMEYVSQIGTLATHDIKLFQFNTSFFLYCFTCSGSFYGVFQNQCSFGALEPILLSMYSCIPTRTRNGENIVMSFQTIFTTFLFDPIAYYISKPILMLHTHSFVSSLDVLLE